MFSACLFHYNSILPSTFRYIGGPCASGDCDTSTILRMLEPIISAKTFQQVKRIYTEGSWRYATLIHPSPTYKQLSPTATIHLSFKTSTKPNKLQSAPGFISFFDCHFILLCHHTHVSPLGITNTNHPYKTPQPFFDASHHPTDAGYAINNWITPSTELIYTL
jgi:hypothetical protein